MKKLLLIPFLILLLVLSSCGFPGDPMLDDMYTKNIYPGVDDTYDIGSPSLEYQDGYIQNLNDIEQINLDDPTELTIAIGEITRTQSFHTVDTEGDAAEDNLDTINGGSTGDILWIKPAHTDRAVTLRNGVGNIYLAPEQILGVFAFNSPAGAAGRFYAGGFYEASVTDANLTQASLTVTYGVANIAHAAHAFLVAAAAGATDAGTVSIIVSGTSIMDDGTRTVADSETIVADITAMANNAYYETTKKWLGTITYTLTGAGGAANFNADFNYGLAKYHDFGNQHFHITQLECVGRAGANDNSFNIRLLHHNSVGWVYDAVAFVAGASVGSASELANMNTDYIVETDLANGLPFAYKRTDLLEEISGDANEGFVIEITTGANKAVDRADIVVKAHTIPLLKPLDSTEEGVVLIYDGTNWIEM